MAEKTSLIKKGEVLIAQGETPSRIFYLQKGSVELLSAPEEYSGLDRNIIIEHSNRVGLISESTYLAGISGRTLRAATDCEVQVIPSEGGFIRFAQQENISHVVFGQSARSRWDILLRGSVLNRFLSEIRDVTVQVVPMQKPLRRV